MTEDRGRMAEGISLTADRRLSVAHATNSGPRLAAMFSSASPAGSCGGHGAGMACVDDGNSPSFQAPTQRHRGTTGRGKFRIRDDDQFRADRVQQPFAQRLGFFGQTGHNHFRPQIRHAGKERSWPGRPRSDREARAARKSLPAEPARRHLPVRNDPPCPDAVPSSDPPDRPDSRRGVDLEIRSTCSTICR